MTLRNEDPARAFLRLRHGQAIARCHRVRRQFAYFVLSDTNDAAVAAAEEAAFDAWKAASRAHADAGLSSPQREYRLQGRQCARFLRHLGAAITS
jgi:membrane glycosyltransferase